MNVVTAPYRLGNYAGEQGIAAYDLGKETGSSDFEALRLATGVTVTRVTRALDLIEATVGGQKIVGDSDSGLGMQDFSSGWERTLHGVAGGLQLVGTATTFAGSVTRFSSAPRVPGSPPINAVNPELANRLAVSNAAKTPAQFAEGSFSITPQGWQGYPAGVPKPAGPFRLLEGAEYDAARSAANSANNQIRVQQGLRGQPVDVHEIQPVKFGGSATDPANKLILDRATHRQQLTPCWNQLMRDITGG